MSRTAMRDVICAHLHAAGGNVTRAAETLGVRRTTLHQRMAGLGLVLEEVLAQPAPLLPGERGVCWVVRRTATGVDVYGVAEADYARADVRSSRTLAMFRSAAAAHAYADAMAEQLRLRSRRSA